MRACGAACGIFGGYTPFRPDVRRKDAGLIRVPNPCSYVTVSGKVPPQAVTSRYVGRSERFGIWLRISRTGRSVGMRRRRTEGGFVSRVLCTVTGCIPFPFAAGRCRTVGLPEADRSSGYALLGCVGDPLFGANPCGRQTGFRAERCWLPSGADIVRVPGETLKTLKIKGRAWPFEKLCVYLRAFVPGCVRTYADAKAAKTRETKARKIFFG